MKDQYPTRKVKEEVIMKRTAPCIHGFDTIGKEGFHKYKRDGFLVIKGFFSDREVGVMQKLANDNYDSPSFYHSPEPDGKGVRSILGFHKEVEIDWVINAKAMMGIREDILGGPSYVHQSRVNYKRGMESNGWKWHSDFETWHYQDGMPDMKCFSAMIPLDDNTHVNGPLMVLKGSHREFVCCPKPGMESSAEDNFSDQKEGIPSGDAIDHFLNHGDIEVVTCEVGDLVIFDCNVLHVSNPNVTPHGRMNMFFVYNALNNMLEQPYSGQAPRPVPMATR